MDGQNEKKNDIKVFEFQVARVPLIEENANINTRTPYVYYGIANLAPQELIRLYNSAPTHRACITSKWYGVRGEGITLKSGDNNRLQMANSMGDSIYDIWNKATLDFILYGAFSLNIVWRKDRDKGFEIHYIDTSKLRAERMDGNDNVNSYYYSSDWMFPRKQEFIPRKIPTFDPNNPEPVQIFYYRTHSPSADYYGFPTYWGAATAVATETEVYNFWHSNIINGLNPSLFVSLNAGIPSPDEREQIYQTMTQKFASSNNPGKLFLTFANNKDEAPEVTTIAPNGSDKLFLEMNQAVQQAILTAHQISSPELLGINVPGKLGSPDHLEAQDHFENLVVKPIQEEIKRVFEKLLNLRDGEPAEIIIEQFKMVTAPDMKPTDVIDVSKNVDNPAATAEIKKTETT